VGSSSEKPQIDNKEGKSKKTVKNLILRESVSSGKVLEKNQ